MKKILAGITCLLLLTQCSPKNTEYKSTLELNQLLISHSISLWKDGLKSKDSFTSGRIHQFNKDMSFFYQEDYSGNTKQWNPFYYNTLSPYHYGNGKSNTNVLKYILEKNQIAILDSLTFNKKLSFESNNSKLMSSNITITMYKTEYNNSDTWFVGKIDHEEFYKDPKEFSIPIFSYKYTIKNNRILSYITSNIHFKMDEKENNFIIKLNEIDVINDKVKYEDFTKKFLHLYTDNLKKEDLNISYE
ncbi:hypothetical protein [Lacinutrix himadriensis]|uniref:hypothetical protein n=1 Tax=Lacinutrix himadriensis TaxID=641549 RepID=UPI0006E3189E|nr:hypothetical protein [Lacinutrix himadriensis]